MWRGTWLLLFIFDFASAAQDRRVTPAPQAQRRMALVIGNSAYTTSPLVNPANDAQALAAYLRQSDFEVTVTLNTDLRALDRAVGTFATSLHAGDAALFYYSGHGMQVEGENYLIPVDFHATQENDVPYQAYPANRVLDRLQGAGASLSILILDACRDNPFRTGRTGTKGLAAMNTGKGSFIAFATAPGTTAGDNPAESNGLFTKHLIETLQQSDLKLGDLFDRVREQVYTASAGKQLPWIASSVIGTFIFRDLEAQAKAAAAERARLEAELKELERQVAEAQQRRTTQEAAEREKEAAAVRERLRFQQAEQDRLNQEAERSRTQQASDTAADKERRQKEEDAKVADLRRQRDAEQARLQVLSRAGMTLAEARRQVASLEVKMEEVSKGVWALRDQALQQLEVDWQPQRNQAKQTSPKGMFETTTQYEERQAAARKVQDEVEGKYRAQRDAIVNRYTTELGLEAQPYREQIAELKRRTYLVADAKVEFANYDADQGGLEANVNGKAYWFAVAPVKARNLYQRLGLARVEQPFDIGIGLPPEVLLVDPENGDKFSGHKLWTGGMPVQGEVKVNLKDGLKYVWIRPGTFTMGCSPGDSQCYDDEKPPHRVTIDKGFWIGQTEITQEAYQRVIGKNPSHFKGPKLPVETVSWEEALSYCQVVGMRLPAEAEWEYAARAGGAGERYGDLDSIAWDSGNSAGTTHTVGQKQANAWGLYDMLGNVWEWVADWYGSYPASRQTDPRGPASGQSRALRGGSWDDGPGYARLSSRVRGVPVLRDYTTGVRCAGN